MKVFYEDILVGEIITNQSLTVDQALELIDFNEEQFISDNGFDDIDYNDFKLVYKEENKMEIMLSKDPVVEKALEVAIEENVEFEYNDTTFVNLKNLYDFVEANSKDGFTFEEVLKEVIEKASENGGPNCFYELGSHETKSGHAEEISFKVDMEYDEEEDQASYTLTF